MKPCLPRAARVTVNSFSSVLCIQRSQPARWVREEGGMLQMVWQVNRTKQKNNTTASSWPWDGKWLDALRATFYPVYVLPAWLSLGLLCLLLFISRFSRMLFEEGIRSSSSIVGFRHYCWRLAWPLCLSFSTRTSETFFQKIDCLCLICSYTQKEIVVRNEGSVVVVMLQGASMLEYCKAEFKILKGVWNWIVLMVLIPFKVARES